MILVYKSLYSILFQMQASHTWVYCIFKGKLVGMKRKMYDKKELLRFTSVEVGIYKINVCVYRNRM